MECEIKYSVTAAKKAACERANERTNVENTNFESVINIYLLAMNIN